MKRALPVLVIALIAGIAVGGSRVVDTNGSPPSDPTAQMLGVYQATAVRGSVRFTDGGAAVAGILVPYYYDPSLPNVGPWEGPVSDRCTLDNDTQMDGGSRMMQSCVWAVSLPTGFVGVALKNAVGTDGGPVTGIVRTEVFSPQY
jgi:hypothetical protein